VRVWGADRGHSAALEEGDPEVPRPALFPDTDDGGRGGEGAALRGRAEANYVRSVSIVGNVDMPHLKRPRLCRQAKRGRQQPLVRPLMAKQSTRGRALPERRNIPILVPSRRSRDWYRTVIDPHDIGLPVFKLGGMAARPSVGGFHHVQCEVRQPNDDDKLRRPRKGPGPGRQTGPAQGRLSASSIRWAALWQVRRIRSDSAVAACGPPPGRDMGSRFSPARRVAFRALVTGGTTSST